LHKVGIAAGTNKDLDPPALAGYIKTLDKQFPTALDHLHAPCWRPSGKMSLIRRGNCLRASQPISLVRPGDTMPLALGHFAVGLLTDSAFERPQTTTRKKLSILFLLVNIPDIDVVISWLATGNPYTYHRLFTHSILFTILAAAAFSNLYKVFPSFPKLSYRWCYWMVMSHLIADYLTTPWNVAFLWPLGLPSDRLNDVLDFVPRYASLEREVEVVLMCLCIYLIIKALRATVTYLQKRLLPA
jgi:membrane-bound metal-dependent hydrolase YbcI (DUF457 family)